MAKGGAATVNGSRRGQGGKTTTPPSDSQLTLVDQEKELELDIFHKTMGIRSIVEQRRLIKFDMAIQRNEVWKETKDVHQQSLLIDSILRKYPIGQVFVIQMGDEFMWMADGKQRWTTVFKFIDNKFALAKGIRPVKAKDNETGEVKVYDIEGKFFKDLDKVLQSKIMGYEMDVKFLQNATPAEIEEIFLRLNNGTPLTKIELTRVELGEVNMIKISDIAEKRFFKTMSFISETSRNRFIDHEMILQTLMIIMDRESGISGNEIREFAKAIKVNGISDEVINVMKGTSDYLADAFEQFVTIKDGKEEMPFLNKMLKKVHVPIIFATAYEAIYKDGRELEPEVFGLWVKSFLVDRKTPIDYKDATAGGSAKKDQVNTRLREMKKDFKKHIENVQKTWEENEPIRLKLKQDAEEEAARLAKLANPDGDGGTHENGGNGEGDGETPPSDLNTPPNDTPPSDEEDNTPPSETPPVDDGENVSSNDSNDSNENGENGKNGESGEPNSDNDEGTDKDKEPESNGSEDGSEE
jgi:hypothetical protein